MCFNKKTAARNCAAVFLLKERWVFGHGGCVRLAARVFAKVAVKGALRDAEGAQNVMQVYPTFAAVLTSGFVVFGKETHYLFRPFLCALKHGGYCFLGL